LFLHVVILIIVIFKIYIDF